MRAPGRTWTAATCAGLLVAATACDGGDAGDPGLPGADEVDAVGLTDEPCPTPVDADLGCLYLGVLSDLTVGPFASLGTAVVEGQRAFWRRVNDQGGIAGFEVDIDTYTRDTEHDPQAHEQAYREIEPEILALAHSFGTTTTQALLADLDADDVVVAPTSWWSGWSFDDADHGLVLEAGTSYCLASMSGLDWSSQHEGTIGSVLVVGYAGDAGRDLAAGTEAWAVANDAEYLGFVETAPNAAAGSQAAAIRRVVDAEVDRVVLGTGPGETAELVGGAVDHEFAGRFLGAAPTWSPTLLEHPAASALAASYTHVGPWEGFSGGSAAHEAMREALGGALPTNDGFALGWVSSYPLLRALEAAAAGGELTRASVRAAVDGLVVDFEGALPEVTFGGEPDAAAPRQVVISVPDADAELGLATVATEVTGPTAEAYAYSSPCSD